MCNYKLISNRVLFASLILYLGINTMKNIKIINLKNNLTNDPKKIKWK
jgi:hypothetical protein